MGKRWEVFALFALVVICLPVLAHKLPIIEYTYVGHIWEEAYTTIPRQPVIGEEIQFNVHVEHPNETIEGNVTGLISIYRDDTVYEWFNGKSYKSPDWILMKEQWMEPRGAVDFYADVVIEEPGSHHVTIDWYENTQYIGQSMHTLDIEQRTLGPMWLAFCAMIILLVCIGVYVGAL